MADQTPSSDALSPRTLYDKRSTNRLKRVEGQVRGVLAMMDDGRPCADIVVQLSAIRSAIDRLTVQVVASQMEQCLHMDIAASKDISETLEEALRLFMKTR
ncbi:MAG: metal-sensitive transcriptional regulator [Firmicutes bacterium]|nr:metal-sensitive transcriptional regulator [Bacillota bacterium]